MNRHAAHRASALLSTAMLTVLTGCVAGTPRWSETESGVIRTVTNRGGQTLGYATTSGVTLLTADRFIMADVNRMVEAQRKQRPSADAIRPR